MLAGVTTLGSEASKTLEEWATGGGAEVVRGVFRKAQSGDGCPRCDPGTLTSQRGIELGHVFYLGTKYSAPLKALLLQAGRNSPMEMGCYGLGMVRRLVFFFFFGPLLTLPRREFSLQWWRPRTTSAASCGPPCLRPTAPWC